MFVSLSYVIESFGIVNRPQDLFAQLKIKDNSISGQREGMHCLNIPTIT